MLGIALGLVFIVLRLFLAPQSPSPRTVVSVPVSQALPEPVVPEVPEPVVEAPPPPGPVVEPSKPSHKSRIALVLDDVGMEAEGAKRAMKLPPFVTLSFMTYAPHLQERADEAKALGHELLLHMPMQPNGNADPGPNALRTDMSYDDVNRLVEEDLGSFKGYDGVNNHMGSKFTADKGRMNVVVAALKKHGVFFLDSRTGVKSVAYDVARSALRSGC